MTKKQLLHVAHTLFALLIGLAPFAPELVAKLGVPTTAGAGATVIAVSAAIVKLAGTNYGKTLINKFIQ
jgi:hypothetical protein